MKASLSKVFCQQGKVELEMILNGEQVFMGVLKFGVVGVENPFYQIGCVGRNVVNEE